MSQSDKPFTADLGALASSGEDCAFCDESGLNTVFVRIVIDHQANSGNNPPIRHMPLCREHYQELISNTNLLDEEEVYWTDEQ